MPTANYFHSSAPLTWLTERVLVWWDGEWVEEDEEELMEDMEHMEDLRDPKEEGEEGGVCHDHCVSPPLMSSKTWKTGTLLSYSISDSYQRGRCIFLLRNS